MARKDFILLSLTILLLLFITETNQVKQVTNQGTQSENDGYLRPKFNSDNQQSSGQPRFLSQKIRGRSRSSTFIFWNGSSSGTSTRRATWQETLIGFGVILGIFLLVVIIGFTCEKCGCIKKGKNKHHHDDHENENNQRLESTIIDTHTHF